MAQRIFRSDDTSQWLDKYGSGADGAYAPSTGTDAPIDSACTGTAGQSSLSATNASFATGQLILIHQTRGSGVGVYEFNKIASYNAGTITLAYPLINSYASGAQVLVIPSYASGNIAAGVTITGKAWNGTVGGIYVKFVNGTLTIAGTVTVKGKGFLGGNGSAAATPNTGYQGEGSAGAGARLEAANGNGGGGGGHVAGSSNAAGSGGGGHTNAGGSAPASGGTPSPGGDGGSAVGVAGLTTLFFGGGSGGNASTTTAVNGSPGGGIVILVAKTIVITGSINTDGTAGTTSANVAIGSTGGSAGGSVLLKGQQITLGTNLVTAAQGLAGTSTNNGNSGDGSVGRIHADYSVSISGSTNPAIDSRQDPSLNTGTGMFLVF